MAVTSPQTLTTAGTRQRVVAVPTDGLPAARHCNRVTFTLLTAGATIYLGLPAPLGQSAAVSSTVYDAALSDTNPNFTIAPTNTTNSIDLCLIYWDASANGVQMAVAALSA